MTTRDDAGKPGLVLDDEPARGAAIAIDDADMLGGLARGIAAGSALALDEGESASPLVEVRQPLKLLDADAILRAARGITSLATVLGFQPDDVEHGRIDDAAVRAQARLFRERWVELEKTKASLQQIKQHEQVAPWLLVVDILAGRLDAGAVPASGLGAWGPLVQDLVHVGAREALVRTASHQRSQRMTELVVSARAFVALDKFLDWKERCDLVDIAATLGFSEDDIAEALKRLERELGSPIKRETEAEWKGRQPKGEWEPHETLGGDDEGWDLARLRAALVDPDKFDEATIVARGLNPATALSTYLRHQRGGKPFVPIAVEAESRASQVECPALAVWWFVWRTGDPIELHVTGSRHQPARWATRRVKSRDELHALVGRAWVIDQLAVALEDGVFGAWLECVQGDFAAARDRESMRRWKRSAAVSRKAVIETLWANGLQGLPLRSDTNAASIATSVSDVLASYQTCGEYLDEALASGLLEAWLAHAHFETLARTAAAIRADGRGVKLYRWLQAAGLSTYEIGGVRVETPGDFALLPKRGVRLEAIWEQVQEGVAQAKFSSIPAVVAALEEVRARDGLVDAARALIACFRLGLPEMPVAIGDRIEWISSPDQLVATLRAPGGRAMLDALLRREVLESWLESKVPGAGAKAAEARGLPPEIAVDRAIRPLLGEVFPAGMLRAKDLAILQALARNDVRALAGDSASRERIRDALTGPAPISGVSTEFLQARSIAPEQMLAELPPESAAMVFAWRELRVPVLHLGDTTVTSTEGFVEAIAKPPLREAAAKLAAAGLLVEWGVNGLGLDLPPPLRRNRGRVEQDLFPALCVALGEPPPGVDLRFTSAVDSIAEGAATSIELALTNADPFRDAVVDVEARPSLPFGGFVPQEGDPLGGVLDSYRETIRVPASQAVTRAVTFQSKPGQAGAFSLGVQASHHACGPAHIVGRASLNLRTRFPWRDVLLPAALWAVCGALGFGAVRSLIAYAGLQPLAGVKAHSLGAMWALGVMTIFVVAGPILLLQLQRRQRNSQSGEAVYRLIIAVGAAAILGIMVGAIVLWLLQGLDVAALWISPATAVAALQRSDLARASAIARWGWVVIGGILGGAWGLAVGLRSVDRRLYGELVRVGAVVLLAVLAAVGAP